MSKKEYLDSLERLLADVPSEERQAALEYYTDYLEDAGPEGVAQAIEHLGTPEVVAAAIKDSINGDMGSGYTTETGYREGTPGANPYAPADQSSGGRSSQNGNGQSSQNGSGQSSHNKNDQGSYYSNGQSGQSGNGQNSQYSNEQTSPRGNGRSSQSDNGQNSQYSNGQQTSQTSNSQNSYDAAADPGTEKRQNKRMALGWIVLIIFGIIFFGIPVFSVAGSLLLAIIATLLAISLSGFAVFLALLIAGGVLAVIGIVKLLVFPGLGIMMAGMGLILLAIAMVALAIGIAIVRTFIPWLCRSIVWIFQKLFHVGGHRS